MKRSIYTAGAIVATLGLALAACSPSTGGGSSPSSSASGSSQPAGEQKTITFRLWDETAAPAYEESFAKFEEKNADIKVEVELVPWGDYWNQLPLDVASGEMADIYWVNSSNFARYADNGNLINITEELSPDHDEWQQSIVDLYTRNNALWGVPQIWDSTALFYNKDLVEKEGIDVTNLKWGGDDDTLLPAAQALTVDKNGNKAGTPDFDPENIAVYGFNAQADLQAIYNPWIASNGSSLQDDAGQFSFADPKGVEAFQYLVDMIHTHHVAPPATETNTNGDITRDMFIRGELAMYQSGPYHLKQIDENTSVKWALAPQVAGPEGRFSGSHGVVAVGNAQTKNHAETLRVLEWLGSAEGQKPLGEMGVSFPGAVDAQSAYVDYWATKGVDVSVFIEAANGNTAKAPFGPDVNSGASAYSPKLLDVFLGVVPVEQGLKEAQDLGNAAMNH
ncbi:ABC transporter substrate-binding protein [Trueperella bialowiezensis]|uniref:Maltodextrin-binding protein mdxE n=1 Tax=Trueperella bialowiezensis TaxID=312285 RepID=A0A448PEM2_9ACTO|nr:sugar ABC transporter substrate-binding protein [Trueperella bialowiezensis]VEI13395.1 Maltodextrin-binding protein mdxE precursor [Trueperella bialowiezensis]